MLWYKAWLETRWRLLIGCAYAAIYVTSLHFMKPSGAAPPRAPMMVFAVACQVVGVMAPTFLAGSGINTQASFSAGRGLHGSTMFTLSLPVSRFRLIAVRAGLGWLGMILNIAIFCLAMWFFFPAAAVTSATPAELFEHIAVLVAGASLVYGISVLYATLLDDAMRIWGTILTTVILYGACELAGLPLPWNIFRALTYGSPLLTHVIPWRAAGLSLTLTAMLFTASWKVVERREY